MIFGDVSVHFALTRPLENPGLLITDHLFLICITLKRPALSHINKVHVFRKDNWFRFYVAPNCVYFWTNYTWCTAIMY